MNTLVDTSVWIDHLRRGNKSLIAMLNDGEVMTHPLIIGELRLGNIPKRDLFFSLMDDLPQAVESEHEEVVSLCENRKLYSKGIGFFDAHLLCSALLSGVLLWTLDKRLSAIFRELTAD